MPTWDYVAVHAHGTVRFFDERERLLEVVTRLTDHHEHARAAPWKVRDAPPDHLDGLLKGIVGGELTITRLEGQWKASQNKGDADRRGVEEGLREEGNGAMADRVRERGAYRRGAKRHRSSPADDSHREVFLHGPSELGLFLDRRAGGRFPSAMTNVLILGANGRLARNTIRVFLRDTAARLTLFLRRASRIGFVPFSPLGKGSRSRVEDPRRGRSVPGGGREEDGALANFASQSMRARTER